MHAEGEAKFAKTKFFLHVDESLALQDRAFRSSVRLTQIGFLHGVSPMGTTLEHPCLRKSCSVLLFRNAFMRILLVEDEPSLGKAVRDQIEKDGHPTDLAPTLAEARGYLAAARHDLILLDLLLPDGRGLDFLRELRAKGSNVPVIILTALDQVANRIAGLNAGADDYLVKPFDLSELSARVSAVARRYTAHPNPWVTLGDLRIDTAGRSVTRGTADGAKRIDLTASEWALLEALIQRPGMIVSRSRLEERLYSFNEEVGSNTIEVHMSRLRKKLGADVIETLRGLGYRIRRDP
jgi:two-component system OmpR family response regulator